MNADNIDAIARKEEVFFVYLHSYSSSPDDLVCSLYFKPTLALMPLSDDCSLLSLSQKTVMDASRSLIGSALVFQSRDPDLFKLTGVSPLAGPVLLSFKDHTPTTPLSTLPFTTTPKSLTVDTVAKFLEENKLPTVVKLDSSNFGDVMRNKRGSLVVLAGLRADGKGTDKLREVATAWRKGGRKFEQGVIFAWMDGDKWAKWLSSNYGSVLLYSSFRKLLSDFRSSPLRFFSMTKSKMPQVVVADPSVRSIATSHISPPRPS